MKRMNSMTAIDVHVRHNSVSEIERLLRNSNSFNVGGSSYDDNIHCTFNSRLKYIIHVHQSDDACVYLSSRRLNNDFVYCASISDFKSFIFKQHRVRL